MSQTSTHRTTFHHYIRAGVQASLARVRSAEHVVPEVDRQQAWHILSFALNVPEVWEVTRVLLLSLAPKMEQAGFREEWIPYLEQGLCCAQNLGDRQVMAQCELQIGLLQRLLSQFTLARCSLQTSLEHFVAIGNSNWQARVLNELAWLEHLQHRYVEATQLVNQALALLDQASPELAMSYRVLGMIAIDQGQWQEAETLHRRALQLFEQQEDQRKIAWSMQNLAYSLRGQGKFEDAITYYQQALALFDKMFDSHTWAMVQMNLGIAYFRYGEAALAEKHHEEAQSIFQKLNDQLNLARNFTNIGLVALALRDHKKAEISFSTSATLFNNLGDKGWSLNAIDGLAMTYLAAEQYELAVRVLESALTMLTDIANTPNYAYLSRSLNEHLQEARRGQGLTVA